MSYSPCALICVDPAVSWSLEQMWEALSRMLDENATDTTEANASADQAGPSKPHAGYELQPLTQKSSKRSSGSHKGALQGVAALSEQLDQQEKSGQCGRKEEQFSSAEERCGIEEGAACSGYPPLTSPWLSVDLLNVA